MAYPLEQVRGEAAFIAYHLHWSLGEIMRLSHSERVEWVGQVSKINQRILDTKQ
jgi:hypothetical protein